MAKKSVTAILIWSCILFRLVCVANDAEKESIRYQLPVRWVTGEQGSSQLDEKGIELFVNNIPKKITAIQYEQKSIRAKPYLGRYFILSFQISEFSQHIKRRISYLIAEIMDSPDTLLVISPYKIYQFKITPNKNRLISELLSLLDQDFSDNLNNQGSIEKNLRSKINQLNEVYSGSQPFQSPYRETVGFLNTFPSEFENYKTIYLSPALEKYEQVVNLLQTKEGQRWWLHFHDFKIYHLFFKTFGIIKNINGYITSHDWRHQAMGLTLSGKLDQFQKQLSFVKTFPKDSLLHTILRGDINFNVIFFGGMFDIDNTIPNQIVSALEGALKEVARNSGGVSTYYKENLQDIKFIENHRDFFFHLNFSFDLKVEEKKIQILLNGQSPKNLYYRNMIKADEIKSMIQYIHEKKVKISGLTFNERTIQFEVKSFGMQQVKNSTEVYGLLRIEVQILDQNRLPVFESKKTLRATKKELAVSISISGHHLGKFYLFINVVDLISNSQTYKNREIILK